MATTSPARIDDDLYASAKLVGEIESRSASQQVVHWARIGRELEASASTSHRAIAEVLAGGREYDSLSIEEQAVVRAEWQVRMDVGRVTLNLAEQFRAEGRTRWVTADDNGDVIHHNTTGG
jgi:ParD-like antitoxin of type II bacterial toxin-antitoxin system